MVRPINAKRSASDDASPDGRLPRGTRKELVLAEWIVDAPGASQQGSHVRLAQWNMLANGLSGATHRPTPEQRERLRTLRTLPVRSNDEEIEFASLAKRFKKVNGGFVGNLDWANTIYAVDVGDDREELAPLDAPTPEGARPIGSRAQGVVLMLASLLPRRALDFAPWIYSLVENDCPVDVLRGLRHALNTDVRCIWAPKPNSPTLVASDTGIPDGVSLLYDARHARAVDVWFMVLGAQADEALLVRGDAEAADVAGAAGRVYCPVSRVYVPWAMDGVCAPSDGGADMVEHLHRRTPTGKPLYKQTALIALFEVSVVGADGAVATERLLAASTHLESDKTADGERARLRQLEQLMATLERLSAEHGVPCALMLDANAATKPVLAEDGASVYEPLVYGRAGELGWTDLLPGMPYTTIKTAREVRGALAPPYIHTIDYILGRGLSTVRRLDPPPPEDMGDMPNPACLSDHLPIVADVALRAAGAASAASAASAPLIDGQA